MTVEQKGLIPGAAGSGGIPGMHIFNAESPKALVVVGGTLGELRAVVSNVCSGCSVPDNERCAPQVVKGFGSTYRIEGVGSRQCPLRGAVIPSSMFTQGE